MDIKCHIPVIEEKYYIIVQNHIITLIFDVVILPTWHVY